MRFIEDIKGEIQNQGGNTTAVFIDFKSAFDKVNHKLLWKKMNKIGISTDLINSIKWLYKETKFAVGDEEIPIGCGVI